MSDASEKSESKARRASRKAQAKGGRKGKKSKRPKPPAWTWAWVWHEWVKPIGTTLVVLFAARSALADWYDVPTGSMKPSILEGDRVFVNKLAYGLRIPFTMVWVAKWDTPDRGEVVICPSPDDGTRLVKRVIAVAGDEVALKNELLYVNGERATYSLADESWLDVLEPEYRQMVGVSMEEYAGNARPVVRIERAPANVRFPFRDFGPITVPEGSVFVMGDNRDQSKDSRAFGVVQVEDVVGRSPAVAISMDPRRNHLPRWDRFFKSIP